MENKREVATDNDQSRRPALDGPDSATMDAYHQTVDQRLDRLDDLLQRLQDETAKGEVQ